ncbi:MAG: TonB-dependent receptor [Paludibacteraceae bacterium]|nr:TonB-dependent receptor [Paludibacteraceae bacterium]
MKKYAMLGLLLPIYGYAEAHETNEDVTLIDEVVVTGARESSDIRHLPMTVSVVGREELVKNEQPNVLPSAVVNVPSLFVTSRGMMGYGVSGGAAGGINLRGISGGTGGLLVLIDGHPQYQGIFGHPISDSYQTMITERVEVLRGPASVLYGSNAMGGVINIVTRGMKEDGVKTDINISGGSWGTAQAEATNRFKKGKFSSTVSGQYGRSDNHRPRMGFEQYGGYLKLGYDFNENWNLWADGNVTHFNASQPGTVDAPMYEADQWITRGVATLALENHFKHTNGRISVYDNFGRHKINDGYGEGAKPQTRFFQSKDALMGVSVYQSAECDGGSRITLGFDYQNIYGDAYYTSRETGEVLESKNKQSAEVRNHEVAGYADFRQNIKNVTFDVGLRVDHHSVAGLELIPQFGAVYRPVSSGEIKAMASKGFRNPSTKDMYLYPPSNEDLKAERLWNYELSWRQRLTSGKYTEMDSVYYHDEVVRVNEVEKYNHGITYGVNLFYMKADNMIQTVAKKNVNTGELENWGVEAELSWTIKEHWGISTNHSWLHQENKLVSVPTYKGYLGVDWHSENHKWMASVGLQQLAGLYTAVGKDEQKENVTLLNATVKYNLNKYIALWVKGENLLAQEYEILAGYPMPKATAMGGVKISF